MYPAITEPRRTRRTEGLGIRSEAFERRREPTMGEAVPMSGIGQRVQAYEEKQQAREEGPSRADRFLAGFNPRAAAWKQNQRLQKYSEDMKRGQGNLAQAYASAKAGDLRQAVVYAGKAYEAYPDGGMLMDIGSPKHGLAQSVADKAGVDEVITLWSPDGNIRYMPLNKQTVGAYLEQGRAAFFDPETYIKGRVTMQTQMQAFNDDQKTHPKLFQDGHVIMSQVNEDTGAKTVESFANKEAFIEKYGMPDDWGVPESEKARADLKFKAAQTRRQGIVSTPGGALRLGREEGEEEIIPGTEPATPLPSTTAETTPVSPAMMVKNEKGEWGWYTRDGKWHLAKGVTAVAQKVKTEKGKLTEKDILDVKMEALKAYDATFFDEGTQQYAEGKGTPEDKRKAVSEAIKLVVPEQYWPKPKLGKPQRAPDGKWYSKDQFDRYWSVPGPSTVKKVEEKPKARITPSHEVTGKGIRPYWKGEKATLGVPKQGIKEPGGKKQRKETIGRQEMEEIDKVVKKEGGREWHRLSRKARRGDIHETINDLEPRKSDPFPQSVVKAIKKYAKQGLSIEEIDFKLVEDINAGSLPTWIMHPSD